jgi:hypothetical protein
MPSLCGVKGFVEKPKIDYMSSKLCHNCSGSTSRFDSAHRPERSRRAQLTTLSVTERVEGLTTLSVTERVEGLTILSLSNGLPSLLG